MEVLFMGNLDREEQKNEQIKRWEALIWRRIKNSIILNF